MTKKLIFTLTLCFLYASSFAQNGALKGKVIDKKTKEGIPFANVILTVNGAQKGGSATDYDGEFSISPIQPGKYDIEASYVGYTNAMVKGVPIAAEKTQNITIEMSTNDIVLTEVEIYDFKIPLISKDETSTGTAVLAEEIREMPTRNVAAIVATSSGTFAADDGKDVNIKGARGEGTVYYIDGIKVMGLSQSARTIPNQAISQMTVITGGVPASFGDAMGGIVTISTKGPSSSFSLGVEGETSQFFDDYNDNLLGLNASGPLWKKDKKTLLGYFLAGELFNADDDDPSAIGIPKVKAEKLEALKKNPFVKDAIGNGYHFAAEDISEKDIDIVQAKPNASQKGLRLSGKLDFQPIENTTFTLGSTFNDGSFNHWWYEYTLFNDHPIYEETRNTARGYARFTQNFRSKAPGLGEDPTSTKKKDVVRNAYYSIQYDYTLDKTKIQNPIHKDRFWDYGYIGQFNKTTKPSGYKLYENSYIIKKKPFQVITPFDTVVTDVQWLRNVWWYNGVDSVTSLSFTPGTQNPVLANYMSNFMDFNEKNPGTLEGIDQNDQNIVYNGNLPGGSGVVNDLFYNAGYEYPWFRRSQVEQHRGTIEASADIMNHDIKIGAEVEQRIRRSYTINAVKLWDHARGLIDGTGQRDRFGLLTQNDTNIWRSTLDPILNPSGDTLTPTDYELLGVIGFSERDGANFIMIDSANATYIRGSLAPRNSNFEKNLRANLGLSQSSFIFIDNLKPEQLKIEYFSPDELIDNGNGPVSSNFYGYDVYGNVQKGDVKFDDFFDDTTAKGARQYSKMAPFQPLYGAAYIQDKFSFKDLVFNIGLRVDYYDANQKVLKDRYSLVEVRTVSEVSEINGKPVQHPSNAASDWVVYVNDADNPKNVLAYRQGDTWYDTDGKEQSGVSFLTEAGKKVIPFKKDLTNTSNQLRKGAFTDYVPQVTYMPRISFSFPISEMAQFFAHYDVLTQRPNEEYIISTPANYAFRMNSTFINNPNLKPQQTTDYQLGFKQAITLTSAITLSAYYRDMKNMIQPRVLTGAYPFYKYTTFDNIDFGSVKGFSFDYDLRRTNNVRIRAGYTLQFAAGTASSTNYYSSLSYLGYDNLRTPMPLDFDQRNQIKFNVDYRFDEGEKYKGPVWGKRFLQNAGLNITTDAGSGTPYSRTMSAVKEVSLGSPKTSTLVGTLNGARKPWQFRINARIDKDIALKPKKEGSREVYLNIYCYVSNLLDTRNILSVYKFTGAPDDDGYLASVAGAQAANNSINPDSYRYLYSLRVNDPDNYSLPRRFKVGFSLNF